MKSASAAINLPTSGLFKERRFQTLMEVAFGIFVIGSLIAIIGLPLLFIGLSSVLNDPFDLASGFSIDTLVAVYTSPRIMRSLWQTIWMSVAVGIAATAIGGLLAWLVTRFRLPAPGLLEMLVLMPLFMSPLIGVIAWVSLGAPNSGLINEFIDMAGGPDWMRINIMSVTGIAFVKAAHYIPYGYLFISSTLRNTDANLEEASYVAGGSVPRTAFNILLPLLRSSTLSSILFISILSSGEFSVSAILGARTDFVPLSVHIYESVHGFPQDFSRATAIGTMLIIISVVAFYFYRRSMRESQRFVTVSGRGFATRQIDAGAVMPLILVVFAFYTFVTVILPYGALLFMVFAKFRTGSLATTEFNLDTLNMVLQATSVQLATVNTLIISIIVPIVCVFFALVLVYANDRLRLKGSEVANYLASIPIAISAIVFASGIFVVYIYTPLYATIWLIALGLVANYITHAIRIVSNGVTQIDRSLEEAASINGASRGTVLRTIVAPLLRPSVYAAMVMIFVFCVREVNTAILLYSPNSILLSVLSWNYTSDGNMAAASVVGVVQTLLMIIVIVAARVFFGVKASKSPV
ncbi:iron ABC transporter permease [Aquamicrobium sp. LC103]|uniref:ABC transporter permease n=1 Tax=Aquamicrobium sp. LC103 TaxID=1120658 RepID=UPI00063E7D6D|nr:iron ABC transporter permease [Aquamicrobium sp. LC103]